MGSTNVSRTNRPQRPRFTWDLRNGPWTDGGGNQEPYATAVRRWCFYHDALPDGNTNKIPQNLRGLTLHAQLYDRAVDLCRSIPDEILVFDDGVDTVVNCLYKRDALSIVNSLFDDFSLLLNTKRGNSEMFKNFEARFSAQVSTYSAHGNSVKLPDSIVALLLLANDSVSDAQRVPILSAAASKAAATENESMSNDEYIQLITYESIDSVIRQCDQGSHSSRNYNQPSGSILTGNSTNSSGTSNTGRRYHNNSGNRSNNTKQKRRLSPDEPRDFKLRTRCSECNKFGHWAADHNTNGNVKDNLPSNDHPPSASNENYSNSNSKKNGNNQSTLNFNMVQANSASRTNFGPMVDSGAPYSAIGMNKLCVLRSSLGLPPLNNMDSLPVEIRHFKWWQYGADSHASEKRGIVGSVMMECKSDLGRPVSIRHLVVDGSSQWLIGRNVTRLCNHIQINDNRLQFPIAENIQDYMSLTEDETHSLIPLSRFLSTISSSGRQNRYITSLVGHSIQKPSTDVSYQLLSRPLNEVVRIIQRVHDHVCGHATYGDMKTLLQRNKLWNDDAQSYLASTVERCSNCIAAAPPPSNRKISISGINRCFNDVVFVDYFWLDEICLFHAMDSFSQYSTAQTVPTTALSDAIVAFENIWISHFWPPSQVQGDLAFRFPEFPEFLAKYNVSFRPVPPRRHHKNLLEPKHGAIRTIYLRLKDASPDANARLLAVSAVWISNEIYGSDTMSAFELAKGYTKPLDDSFLPQDTSDRIVAAHDELVAKRKLTLLLRSKATHNPAIKAGDLVQVYFKQRDEKRGKWLSPRTVLSFDYASGIVTVPGSAGRPIHAAVEDVRLAITQDEMALHISESNDQLDVIIDSELSDTTLDQSKLSEITTQNNESTIVDCNPDFDNIDEAIHNPSTIADGGVNAPPPSVGENIEVFWPEDDQYYPGLVSGITDSGQHVIKYNDGDSETLNMSDETWRPDSTLNANTTDYPSLKSDVQTVLREMLDSIGNKSFLLHHGQSFPQYVIYNAYEVEENEFKKHVRCVPIPDVPNDANIVASHTVYKIKVDENDCLRLKARIAPHGNEDSIKSLMKYDCAMCLPTGIRIVLLIAAIMGWTLTKADVKAAFLQTGKAERDVYVRQPRESPDKRHYWLLLAAAYGLVNANANFQTQADELITEIGLSHMTIVPQLFYLIEDGKLVLIVAKIVDDLLLTGTHEHTQNFLNRFNKRFKFGTVVSGPGILKFYGMTIEQMEDFSSTIHADEKLYAIDCFPLSRVRRRQCDSPLKAVEKSSFMSVNSSLGWIGVAASPLCAFYASYLEQKMSAVTVDAIRSQINYLRLLKGYGSMVCYPATPSKSCSELPF